MKPEELERLENRLEEIKSCKTPEELSFVIWTKELENAIGSRRHYREPFIDWIKCYKFDKTPQWKDYKYPKDLVEGIWKPFLDEPGDIWFKSLRETVIEWIEDYKQKG